MTATPYSGRTASPRTARAINDRLALELLQSEGPLTATQLKELTGLSRPSVADLVERLGAAGLIHVVGESGAERRGPNARVYGIVADRAHLAAVDVRTHSVAIEVADLLGRTIGRAALPVDPLGDPRRTVKRSVALLERTAREAGATALHTVAVGAPGLVDPATGELRATGQLPMWHSVLVAELRQRIGIPVLLDNEVNLAAVAEQRLGVANGHEDFVLLWNQEGIGAALVIGGRLHRGRTGGAGEVGFLPVPGTPLVRDPAHTNSGGFQELAGANAVLRWARELGLPHDPAAALHDNAADLVARAVVAAEGERAGAQDRTSGGDGPHGELLRRLATGIAIGLASMVAVLDPQLIVLSGGVLTAGGEPLRELVQAELTELAVPRPLLVLGTVTEQPVLHGALESALATTRDEVFDTSR